MKALGCGVRVLLTTLGGSGGRRRAEFRYFSSSGREVLGVGRIGELVLLSKRMDGEMALSLVMGVFDTVGEGGWDVAFLFVGEGAGAVSESVEMRAMGLLGGCGNVNTCLERGFG